MISLKDVKEYLMSPLMPLDSLYIFQSLFLIAPITLIKSPELMMPIAQMSYFFLTVGVGTAIAHCYKAKKILYITTPFKLGLNLVLPYVAGTIVALSFPLLKNASNILGNSDKDTMLLVAFSMAILSGLYMWGIGLRNNFVELVEDGN